MVIVWVAWLAFWLWAFSLAFSDSFFVYNRHSRIPTLAAAWLGSAGILASACVQWARRRPLLAASLWHLLGVIASAGPLVLVSALLSRAPDPWHLSADDAMGVGIDFMLLCALGAVSVVVLPVGLALREAIRPTR